MEDQIPWKGHVFTLLVFTGIVVLCAIFFILGMLVGRNQGQRIALTTQLAAAAKAEAVRKEEPPVLQPPPAVYDSLQSPESSEAASKTAHVLNYQIGALRNPADAEKLLNELKKKGFHALILAPAADDSDPFFRVQVGPIDDPVEAEDIKQRLESAGYKPIVKR
jgi:cell division septation protein DedD